MIRGLWVWAITALGLAVIAHLNIGIHATSAVSVIIAALALGLLNTFIRPILRLIAIPITFLTLGLFGWMINGLMLWLVSWLVPRHQPRAQSKLPPAPACRSPPCLLCCSPFFSTLQAI